MEVRSQCRRPFVWFCIVAYFLLATADTAQAGWSASGGAWINGADAIATRAIIYSILGVIAAAGIVSEPFARERRSSTIGIVLATGAGRRSLALARFVVVLGFAVCAGLMLVPGVVLGTLAPGIAPEYIGPTNWAHLAAASVYFVVPNFLLFSAVAFALASRSRSQAAAFAGAVVFVSIWVTIRMVLGQDVLRHEVFAIAALLDPFGSIASAELTMGRTVAENNELFPPLSGLLLWNRLVWLGVSTALIAIGVARFPLRETLGAASRRGRLQPRRGRRSGPVPFGMGRLAAMSAWELRVMRRTPGAKLVLALMAVSLWWSASSVVTHRFSLPSTDLIVHNTGFYFDKVLLLAIVWLAGDLVWRERQQRVDPLLDVLPTRDWERFASKLVALISVVCVFWLLSIAVGLAYQAANGYFEFELGLYVIDTFAMKAPYFVFVAVLALAVQVLVGRRYVAMGITLLVLLSELAFDALGMYHPLYRFGRSGFFWYSLMDGYGHFWRGHLWMIAYWSIACAILALVAGTCFGRGYRPGSTLATIRARSNRSVMAGCVALVALMTMLGAHVWVQSTVRAQWPLVDAEALKAEVERRYSAEWRDEPQPRVVAVSTELDLYPRERSFELRGRYTLRNTHGVAIDRVLVLAEPWLDVEALSMPGAELEHEDADLNVWVLALDIPIDPGAEIELAFESAWRPPEGFSLHARNDGIPEVGPTEVLGNGTSLLNLQIMPAVGYTDRVEHKPSWKRRKFGLDPEWTPPNELFGLRQAHATYHLDWVERVEFEVTTDADQMVYHPGERVATWTAPSGRRGFRYVIETPSRGWATLVSGRLVETRFSREGVPDVILAHDPDHTHTLKPLAEAMLDAIEHFQARYGPPPFDDFYFVEQSLHFDGLGVRSGMGFASEVLGWKTDVRGMGAEELHEMAAHIMGMTWFGDQIIPANVRGAKVVHAGLPYWAGQLYLSQRRDPETDRRVRMQKLLEMFRGRSTLIDEEAAFAVEFKDSTMVRAKGAVQLLHLAQLMGGPAALEAAFAEFLDRWKHRGPRFATVDDFLSVIRDQVPPEHHPVVDTIFHDIATWKLEIVEARRERLPDGRWLVEAEFGVEQFSTTGWGERQAVDVSIPIDAAVFGVGGVSPPGELARHTFVPGDGGRRVSWLVSEEPAWIAIDPYLLVADLNPRDNARRVD